MLEPITCLLFPKRRDDLHIAQELKASRLKQPTAHPIVPEAKDPKHRGYDDLRWSRFKYFAPIEMFEALGEPAVPFLRTRLSVVALIAVHSPSRRATQADPIVALRTKSRSGTILPERSLLSGDHRHTHDTVIESLEGAPLTSASPPQARAAFLPGGRWTSALEFLLGAGIVVGHNVFQALPNEVPILFVLGLVSFRLRNGGWAAMGFRRPSSWTRIVLIALAATTFQILFATLVIEPVTAKIWPVAVLPEGADEIAGNAVVALRWLGLAWIWAAFGEEIGYRGYLVNRAADVGGRTNRAYWVGVLLVAILFGIAHWYKGPSGMIDSGFSGLMFGTAYLLSGRNLWASVLAHGFIDTFGIVALFLGWIS